MLFSGDALLINTCGRTDFQSGSSKELYSTIKNIFYKMPDETKVFPAHDYNKNNLTTIMRQKSENKLISGSVNLENFILKMKSLKLDRPKKIDIAVPRNMECGFVNQN